MLTLKKKNKVVPFSTQKVKAESPYPTHLYPKSPSLTRRSSPLDLMSSFDKESQLKFKRSLQDRITLCADRFRNMFNCSFERKVRRVMIIIIFTINVLLNLLQLITVTTLLPNTLFAIRAGVAIVLAALALVIFLFVQSFEIFFSFVLFDMLVCINFLNYGTGASIFFGGFMALSMIVIIFSLHLLEYMVTKILSVLIVITCIIASLVIDLVLVPSTVFSGTSAPQFFVWKVLCYISILLPFAIYIPFATFEYCYVLNDRKHLEIIGNSIYNLNFNNGKITKLKKKKDWLCTSVEVVTKKLVHNIDFYRSYLPDNIVNNNLNDSTSNSSMTTNATHGSSNTSLQNSGSLHESDKKKSFKIEIPKVRKKVEYRNVRKGLSRKTLTVLHCRIINFRDILGLLTSDEFSVFYELILNAFVPILRKYESNIDFNADVISGTFLARSFLAKHDSESAVLAALELQGCLEELNETLLEMGFPKIRVNFVIVKYRDNVFEGHLGTKKMRRACVFYPNDLNDSMVSFLDHHNISDQVVFDEKVNEQVSSKFVTKLIQIVMYENEKKMLYQVVRSGKENGKELQKKLMVYEEAWDFYYEKKFVEAQSCLLKFFEYIGDTDDDGIAYLAVHFIFGVLYFIGGLFNLSSITAIHENLFVVFLYCFFFLC